MRKVLYVSIAAAAVAALAVGSFALAGSGTNHFKGDLSGYNETLVALSTTGTGSFEAKIDEGAQEINYTLSYADLEGTVAQAHIHFGASQQTGGISAFFCTNLGNGPAGTQPCPAAPATVTGTIRPADVIGPAGQGITAGEWGELVAAMRAGKTYANVHTSKYPGGEIRVQLRDK